MPNVVFFLQFLVAIFSLLAGGFWMASAYGRTVGYPWQQSRAVPPAELMDHQTKWNGMDELRSLLLLPLSHKRSHSCSTTMPYWPCSSTNSQVPRKTICLMLTYLDVWLRALLF
jgi:hypothetical protein